MHTRNVSTAIALLAASLALAVPAFAQGFTFGLRPEDQRKAYFEYTLLPGDRVEDAVLVVNGTDEPLSLVVTKVAGHTALTGGISFPGDADGPGSWIELYDQGVVEVPTDLALRMPFTLSVPADTPPGEYVAGFLSTPEDPAGFMGSEGQAEGFQVEVIPQMAVSMIITIAEPSHCEVRIDAIQHTQDKGEWNLVMTMVNMGDVHFKGSGEFKLKPTGGGDPVLERSFPVGYFIAGETLEYPLNFNNLPPAGDYEAEVTLLGSDCAFNTLFNQPIAISDELAAEAAADSERWALADQNAATSPVQSEGLSLQTGILIGLIVLVLILILLLLYVILTRRRKDAEDAKSL